MGPGTEDERMTKTLSDTLPEDIRSMVTGPGIYRFHMKEDDTVHDGVIFLDQYGVYYYQLVDAGTNSNKWGKVASVSKQMMPHEYMKTVRKRVSPKAPLNDSGFQDRTNQVLHGIMGAVEESVEYLGHLRKQMFYKGNDEGLDIPNLLEEAGDAFFFWCMALDAVGLTLNDVFYANDKKLAMRHGNKFNEKNLETRNIAAERKILEEIINILPPREATDHLVVKKEPLSITIGESDEALANPLSTVVLPPEKETNVRDVDGNHLTQAHPNGYQEKGVKVSRPCSVCPTKHLDHAQIQKNYEQDNKEHLDALGGSDGGHIQPPNVPWNQEQQNLNDLPREVERMLPAAKRFVPNHPVKHKITKKDYIVLAVCKCEETKGTKWEAWGVAIPLADTKYDGGAPCQRIVKIANPNGTVWVDSQYLDRKDPAIQPEPAFGSGNEPKQFGALTGIDLDG